MDVTFTNSNNGLVTVAQLTCENGDTIFIRTTLREVLTWPDGSKVMQEIEHTHQTVPGPFEGALAFLTVFAASAGQPFDVLCDEEAQPLHDLMVKFISRPDTGTVGVVVI